MDRDFKLDLVNLTKYPEFYAFKKEVLDFIEQQKDEIVKLDVSDAGFPLKAGSKVESIKALQGFLQKLGVIEHIDTTKKRKTYE